MDRTNAAETEATQSEARKRAYVKQSDVPAVALDEALRIPFAIAEQYAKQPASPLEVGKALDIRPGTGHFRSLAGAALAYGVTEGGAWADTIALTDLGRRIVSPTVEGDDLAAKREALMRPRVVHDFLERYNGSPLPATNIAVNVLETMGVPAERGESIFDLIVEGAESLGLILEVSGKRFVNLRGIKSEIAAASPAAGESDATDEEDSLLDAVRVGSAFDDSGPPTNAEAAEESDARFDGPQVDRNRRVFVSHGSNRKIVEHLKELLEYGEYEPVVAVERETTSKPVPDKVLDDMRSCAAGIIHVGVERVITDASGAEFPQLNSNVLIEIGAAMALYGRNFILLVEEGTTLPSNLQGLYEVRYEGKSMDAGATMKLLKAFKDFKAD
jgi:hypothetical protein